MSQKIKKLEEPHFCKYCGKELIRKRAENGRLEDFSIFKKRKYCNLDCFNNYRWMTFSIENHNQDYRPAHSTAKKIAKRFLNTECCELCGSTQNIDIHHKDEDYTNNNIDNLQSLCRSCHMKQHKKKGICIICGKPQKGHGYCAKHMQRYKKYNCPFFSKFHTSEICKKCTRDNYKVENCVNTYLLGEENVKFNRI